jgi:hypothetical protein
MSAPDVLSDEWVAAYGQLTADLPARPGWTARVEQVVTGGRDGAFTWWVTFVDGRSVDAGRHEAAGKAAAGSAESAGAGDPPLVTFTLPYSLAQAIAVGEVELSAAFMQGRAKMAGDQTALIDVLALTATPEYRTAVRALADAATG